MCFQSGLPFITIGNTTSSKHGKDLSLYILKLYKMSLVNEQEWIVILFGNIVKTVEVNIEV